MTLCSEPFNLIWLFKHIELWSNFDSFFRNGRNRRIQKATNLARMTIAVVTWCKIGSPSAQFCDKTHTRTNTIEHPFNFRAFFLTGNRYWWRSRKAKLFERNRLGSEFCVLPDKRSENSLFNIVILFYKITLQQI